jgi:hypothetical protein
LRARGIAPQELKINREKQLELLGALLSWNGGRPVDDPGTTYIRRAIYPLQKTRGDAIRASTIRFLQQRTPMCFELVDLPARQGVGDCNDS